MALRDKAFQRAFSRLFVYNILFEDSEVDERFLGVGEDSSVLGISGAGCGMAGLVSGRPRRVDAVDINHHHLALCGLKVAAAQRIADYEEFYELFGRGRADDPEAVVTDLASYLPPWMQRYWKRHADRFERSLYRQGLTAKMLSLLRKRSGVDVEWLRGLCGLSPTERGEAVSEVMEPLFRDPLVKGFAKSPLQLVTLGINFRQRDRMLETEQTDIIAFFLRYLRRLAEQTDLETNWFAWWALTCEFNHDHDEAAPPYLRRDRHERSYGAPTAVDYHRSNIFDVLEEAGPNTWTHYMFCDAPDWMPPETQTRLLEEVHRTSKNGAIMLYRSVERDTMVQRLGFQDRFHPMESESDEASRLDRTKQYRRVNFCRVVH